MRTNQCACRCDRGLALAQQKRDEKRRENDESVCVPLQVCEVIKCDAPGLSSTSFDLVSLPPVSGCLGG